jgi:hypothetical protein
MKISTTKSATSQICKTLGDTLYRNIEVKHDLQRRKAENPVKSKHEYLKIYKKCFG